MRTAHRRTSAPLAWLALWTALAAGCSSPPVAGATNDPAASPGAVAPEVRKAALAAARVWHPPPVPVSQANLRVNPADDSGLSPDTDLACRFTRRDVGGTTPKFYCEGPGGEVFKIKYGGGNPELGAEVAASRLLTALGFWSDQMFVVRSVRCAGCPRYPFFALRCLQRTGLESACLAGSGDADRVTTFPFVVVERRLQGRVLESSDDEGWAWFELAGVDATAGGASRAELDALRLMAVFLAHWDNKAPNQRLVCRPGADLPDGGCREPVAIMQDLGATFGPLKLDLQNWRSGRIWKDASTCSVSMKDMPWGGGTFPDAQISEEGRRLLLGLLEQLSDAQLRDLFEGSRATAHGQLSADAGSVSAWVAVFRDRVRQIRDASCPN